MPVFITKLGASFGVDFSNLTSEWLGSIGAAKINTALHSSAKTIGLLQDVAASVAPGSKTAPARKRSIAGTDVVFFSDPNGFVSEETKAKFRRDGGGGGVLDGVTGALGLGQANDLLGGLLGGFFLPVW